MGDRCEDSRGFGDDFGVEDEDWDAHFGVYEMEVWDEGVGFGVCHAVDCIEVEAEDSKEDMGSKGAGSWGVVEFDLL